MSHPTVLTLSYDGTGFAGFARQPGQLTVQGRLETALATVLGQEVETTGAGRTDTGVHALGQVVSFEADTSDLDLDRFVRSLNALVGDRIVVTGARLAAEGFSARHSAVTREYRYRMVPGPVRPLFLAGYAWWLKGAPDLRAMRQGAEALIGEHDFKSFCVSSSAEGKRTVRRMDVIEIFPESVLGEHSLVLRIAGNAFLHSMVRTVVGTLVEVGLGRKQPDWVADVLEARDRSAAGPTAPARGLTLWHVEYPAECWL